MNNNTRKFFGFLIASVFTVSASATIVDQGLYTDDTASGLRWLDVTATANMSFDDVSGQLNTGGSLFGWRYATGDEFDQLMVNFGFVPSGSPCENGGNFCNQYPDNDPAIENVTNILGFFTTQLGDRITIGFIADKSSFVPSEYQYQSVAYIGKWPFGPVENKISTADIYTYPANKSPGIGSFLVQSFPTSEVPVPAAAWLMGSGLIGLAGLARRKK